MKPGDVVKFRICVRGPRGNEWWEEDEREVGTQNRIRGCGVQPEFTGDVVMWGHDIVDWFNKSEPVENHRTFVKAEILPDVEGQ